MVKPVITRALVYDNNIMAAALQVRHLLVKMNTIWQIVAA